MCDDYRGSKCDVTELCGSNRTNWLDCDLLGISRYHWSVGGNLTIKGDTNDSPYGIITIFTHRPKYNAIIHLSAYANCKRDPECSARTIQGYLASYEAVCISYLYLYIFSQHQQFRIFLCSCRTVIIVSDLLHALNMVRFTLTD